MDQRIRELTRLAAQTGAFEDTLAVRRERDRAGYLVTFWQEAQALKRLLAELKAADAQRHVFGAKSHDYRILPPLSEEEVEAFERQHEVLLPDDYRAFLTLVSAGGAGPYYGLHPLEVAAQGSDLSVPFPWVEKVELEEDEDYDAWSVGAEERMSGVLQLCHQGCAYYDFLVVRGAAAGSMWLDLTAADMGLKPQEKTFTQWYRHWLESKLRLLTRLPLLKRIRPGMTLSEAEGVLGPTVERRPVTEGQFTAFFEDLAATLRVNGDRVTDVFEMGFV